MTKPYRVAAVALVAFIMFATWLLGGWSRGAAVPATTATAISNLWLGAAACSATVFAGLAARSEIGRQRTAWLALTLGLIGWLAGQLIWSYYEVVARLDPFPSLADVGYLILPVGAGLALLLYPDDYSNFSLGRVLLDGLIVAGSLFLVSWVTVLSPIYEASDPGDRLGLAVSLAYPLADVAILTIAVMVLIRAETHRRQVLTLLTVGIACIALSDSAFVLLNNTGNYATGGLTDLGWVGGFLLLTVAAAAGRGGGQQGGDPDQLPGWASVWLPYAPLVLAALVAASRPTDALNTAPVWAAGALLLVAVLSRQLLAVSENRRLLAKVAEQARRDPLTGLANRTALYESLERALELGDRDGDSVAVLSLDLNDFKLVNDTFGHLAGDELLTLVAERLVSCVRTGDTVARLGGDEFVILLQDSVEECHVVANRILSAFDDPFTVHGHLIAILPSLGLTIADPGRPATSCDELLRQADVAMYTSKYLRTRVVQAFAPGMPSGLVRNVDGAGASLLASGVGGGSQLELLGQLRLAIDRSELTLRYQPQIDLSRSQIVGVEALVRWEHPVRGLLGAEEFLPLVTRYGLMESVNSFVLERALDDARRWNDASFDIPVAVNFFAPMLATPELPATITAALADRGLSAGSLIIEITEQQLINQIDRTKVGLSTLRSSGVRIALDDFGGGYSALSHLRDLPVHQLKLDCEFVAPILDDERAAALVNAVVGFAHTLGLQTVAEGVENAAVAEKLREYGCDEAQGYFFSPPVVVEELISLLATAPDWVPAPVTSD